MLSKEEKISLTTQVLKSQTFSKTTSLSTLLRYLVEAEIEDRFLKEGIIDIEFYGSKNTDKNTPRVRVNIYNLRKKLEKYYEEEGKDDQWRILIEKGQYSVKFVKQPSNSSRRKINIKTLLPYILLTLVIVSALLSHLAPPKPAFWKAFLNPDNNTNLCIGDGFGIVGKTVTGNVGWNRDYDINNPEDYYDWLAEHPEMKDQTYIPNYYRITSMGVNATHQISMLFAAYNHDFDVRFSSNMSYDDIKKGNAIYAGPMKTQPKFITTFNAANSYFTLENGILEFSGHPTLESQQFNTNTSGVNWEYAIVSRIPGPENTEQFLFFSDHDLGVQATVNYFTNRDSIIAFREVLSNEFDHFTAVFRVNGKERTDLDIERMLIVGF